MIDKIEAAKEISSTVSENVAKISAEISQCVAMGAKAYTFIKVLDIVASTLCWITFVMATAWIVNKFISHKISLRRDEFELEKTKLEKRGY